MTIKYHPEMIQGSDDWFAIRCGLLTASEMKLIITPNNLKPANNDKERAHLYELLAQRITKYVEPHFIGDDMLRGMTDEIEAKILYAKHYAPVADCGFITNDKWGFTLGYSPDGLVGVDGAIECKSRRQKYQVQTILDAKIPDEYLIQVQTGLLISERAWVDFITYSAGLPMMTMRVYPDTEIQTAIVQAASIFNDKLDKALGSYNGILGSGHKFINTERRVEGEIE